MTDRPDYTTVPLNRIICRERIRTVSPETVDALAASINEIGLLNPLTVSPGTIVRDGGAQDGYTLVSGAHRLEAVKQIGWTEVAVTMVDLIGPEAVIAECDENLCGTNLSKAERALFTAARKKAYIALHPETRSGYAGATVRWDANSNFAPAFTTDTAAKTGQSERSVQLDAERGAKIPEALLKDIAGTPLDKGVVLDKLAKSSNPKQTLTDIKQKEKGKKRSAKREPFVWDEAANREKLARAHAAAVDGANILVQKHTARGTLDFFQDLRRAGSDLDQVELQFIKLLMPDRSKSVFLTEEEIQVKFGGTS